MNNNHAQKLFENTMERMGYNPAHKMHLVLDFIEQHHNTKELFKVFLHDQESSEIGLSLRQAKKTVDKARAKVQNATAIFEQEARYLTDLQEEYDSVCPVRREY